MFRINLKNDLLNETRRKTPLSAPRVSVAIMTAVTAAGVWACSSSNFDVTPPGPTVTPSGKKNEPQPLNPADGGSGNPRESEPQDPKRVLSLQITGVQPDAWWNNCLKIEMGEKTFDIGCTKDKNVTSNVVRIPIPDGVDCPVIDLKISTFRNTGDACRERTAQGLACEGPFESEPFATRSFSSAEGRPHFVLSDGQAAGTLKVVRAFYEDQDAQSIRDAKDDPAKAEQLGIDFNDAIFDIKTGGLPFEIRGAPGTKCQ
jgi:hypothetical protein